jgi:hypothetical protein
MVRDTEAAATASGAKRGVEAPEQRFFGIPWGPIPWADFVGRPGLDPGTLGLKVPCSSG